MKKHTLEVSKRTNIGRKVKNLRKTGQLPATIYGKNIPSVSVTIPAKAFEVVYGQAGETGLVQLTLDGQVRPTLIHTVQKNPLNDQILHVEFHQVDLKEKVHAKVPVEFVGEAAAVTGKTGVLLTILDEIEVEALPTDLPEKLTLDVSALAEVDQELKVTDIQVPKGVEVLTDSTLSVVKVGSLVSREAEAEAAAEAAAAAAAAAEAAPAEGVAVSEAPAEGAPQAGQAPAKPQEETR